MVIHNQRQQQALEIKGPVFVRAGPGTGKTTLIAAKVLQLIKEREIPAHTIFVLSFSRDAANQLRNRLTEELDGQGAGLVQTSTLHALAYKVCRAHSEMSLDPGQRRPRVLREGEGREILWEIITQDLNTRRLENKNQIWQQFQVWKATGVIETELPGWLKKPTKAFNAYLQRNQLWDLSDLIPMACLALQENQLLSSALEIRFLCVDEFQDLNKGQYDFFKHLAGSISSKHKDVFLVGAEAQSIYGFRGADFSWLEKSVQQDFPGIRTVVLNESFRSGSKIIKAASSIVSQYEEVYLHTGLGEGKVLWHAPLNVLREANFIAERCHAMKQNFALDYSKMAVLLRSWNQRGAIEKALEARGIPYQICDHRREKFLRTRTVLAAAAYLRVIRALKADCNVLEHGLDLILNTPERGIGPISTEWILGGAVEIGWNQLFSSLYDRRISPAVRLQIRGLIQDLLDLVNSRDQKPRYLLDLLLRKTGWWQDIRDDPFERDQRNSLEHLLDLAKNFHDLDKFLAYLKKGAGKIWEGEGIAISSIHGAKGMEWPVVFIPGFLDGTIPSSHSIKGTGDIEEEARLVHVALSRAKDLVFVTWPQKMDWNSLTPSRFLSSLFPHLEKYDPETFRYQALKGERSENSMKSLENIGFPVETNSQNA